MQILFKQLRDGAKLPERKHASDVGLDLYTPAAGVLRPGINKVPLGWAIDLPVGYNASVYPRTGMVSGAATLKLEVVKNNGASTATEVRDVILEGVSLIAHLPPIDPGYTGEINLLVFNHSDLFIKYPQHTRFGQLVVHPIVYAQPVTSEDKSRGDAGFGSTGA